MVNNVTAIIQARLSSMRLSGKVLLNLADKPVILHIIERLKRCQSIDQIILATSGLPEDDPLADAMESAGIPCYRGSLDNVLQRFYHAAIAFHAQSIVRICADSPLLDGKIIDGTVRFFLGSDLDIVKTGNVPLGLGVEVFSFAALSEAYQKAREPHQLEHVTPYIYQHLTSGTFFVAEQSCPYRLTMDTKEDFGLIHEIYARLYHGEHDFYLPEILALLANHPELLKINAEIKQVQVPFGAYSLSGKENGSNEPL